MLEWALPMTSQETIGSSQNCRMPLRAPWLAAFNAALTSSAVVSFVEFGDQVDHGAVDGRHAHGHAVQFAFKFRQHLADGHGRRRSWWG